MENESGIVTTQEEIEGYLIIKAILCSVVDPARVVMCDRQTYCGILLTRTTGSRSPYAFQLRVGQIHRHLRRG